MKINNLIIIIGGILFCIGCIGATGIIFNVLYEPKILLGPIYCTTQTQLQTNIALDRIVGIILTGVGGALMFAGKFIIYDVPEKPTEYCSKRGGKLK